MNNKLKRIVAFYLATLMIVMQLPITVQAKESNTLKEEVVYINLYADGTVKEIYVVNVFELDENGKVIDYVLLNEVAPVLTDDITPALALATMCANILPYQDSNTRQYLNELRTKVQAKRYVGIVKRSGERYMD